ncbi:staphylopine family metallophore export MFS transporter CntE [Gorillibacterium sp. sgz5001074]|uniref:staphylopine family metallophore export MFS transporter CntE n=1 Tax=Gorillibacterium sp. sgz5001074 TaxID=3446695 RepID=UPI003F67807E
MKHAERKGPLSSGPLRLYALTVLFFTANAFLTVILPLQSDAKGMEQGEIGLMMGAYMLTCMLFRPWAGQVISRMEAWRLMRRLVIVHAACLVLYALSDTKSLLWLMGLRAMQGAVTAFFSMTMQLGMVDMLAESDRAQGMSLYTLSTMLPQLFAPVMILAVWKTGDWPAIAAILLVLGFLTGLAGYKAPLPASPMNGGAVTSRDMLQSFTQIWRNRSLFVCSAVMLAVASLYGTVLTFLPIYLEHRGEGHAGYYLTLQGFVVVICRFVLRKALPSDGRWVPWLVAGLLLSAVTGSLLLALPETVHNGVYLSAVCNGITIALVYPLLVTYLTFVLPASHRAVLLGLFISSYDLGFSAGAMLMGMVSQWSSYSGMFFVCSGIILASLVIVLLNKDRMHGAKGRSII